MKVKTKPNPDAHCKSHHDDLRPTTNHISDDNHCERTVAGQTSPISTVVPAQPTMSPQNILLIPTTATTALRTLRTCPSIHARALCSPSTTGMVYHSPQSKPTHRPNPDPRTLLAKYAEHPTDSIYRWETPIPSSTQLRTAVRFFTRYQPQHIWSAAEFKRISFGTAPEVAFLGRSNVGKSSLLNALVDRPLAFTSSKPGCTKLLHAYSVAGGRCVLLDMPGYGHNSRAEWGVQVMKYLQRRRELRRVFLLVDAEHGFKSFDRLMVRTFAKHGISFQIVLSKVDKMRPEELVGRLVQARAVLQGDDWEGQGEGDDWRAARMSCGLGEIIGTAANPSKKKKRRIGINDLRWSIMVAMGLDEDVNLKSDFGAPVVEVDILSSYGVPGKKKEMTWDDVGGIGYDGVDFGDGDGDDGEGGDDDAVYKD